MTYPTRHVQKQVSSLLSDLTIDYSTFATLIKSLYQEEESESFKENALELSVILDDLVKTCSQMKSVLSTQVTQS